MSFDFGNFGEFDSGDAAILGGIMGFAEESFREEHFGEDEDAGVVISIKPEDIKDVNLRLVYNQDPEFFTYIVKLVIEQNKKWRSEKLAREVVKAELEALEKCEKLLEENANVCD